MGVLGKDLFDIGRPRTHVKVQFGQSAYWVEYDPTSHPYGEVLTALLNCNVAPYEQTLSVLEQAIGERDAQTAPQAFMDTVRDLSSLPYFRLFLSDLQQFNDGPVENFVVGEARIAFEEYIFSEGEKDIAYMREQANAVRFIQERYSWFLTEAFQQRTFEKKKGQRKVPLAQQIYENCLDAFVSGVSLGKSPEVDAPQVNIQYAVLEISEEHHELVEKLYFDRLEDFVYVELMRGLQRGFVPKRCANCGRWFLQTPGASYNYCDQPAPNSEEGKTCREVGSTKSFRAKVLNNEIWAIHQRAYKKYFARTKKGTMTKPNFLVWETESERLRDEALSEYDRAKTEDEKAAIAERLREELNRQ